MRRVTMSKKYDTQINIIIPHEWKEELDKLVLLASVEAGRTVTFQEFMRQNLQEKFQLDHNALNEQASERG